MGRSLTTELAGALTAALAGEVRFDPYTRHLYSTDASLYAIEPLGVARELWLGTRPVSGISALQENSKAARP